MNVSSDSGSKPFESKEWDSIVVLREDACVWFGFSWQRNGGFLFMLLALGLALGGIGVFLEPPGLRENLGNVQRVVLGTGVFIVAAAIAFVGIRFVRGTDRLAMLDLEKGEFAVVDQKSEQLKQAFPCGDLYIQMAEVPPDESDTGVHGKITIVGPGHPDDEPAPDVNVTLAHYLPYEPLFNTVRELERAASWKGIIGEETWIKMYRSRT